MIKEAFMKHLSIAELKELTASLPSFPPASFKEADYKELPIKNGIIRLWDLLWTPQISVTKFHMNAGSLYENHVHSGTETIFIANGVHTLFFDNGDKEVTLHKGHSYYIKPGVVHRGYSEEETLGIAVIIPAEEEYRGD